jgi:hypothetical protein
VLTSELAPFAPITWDHLLALASDPVLFKLIPPPLNNTRNLSPDQLPCVAGQVNTLHDVMMFQVLLAFFEARGDPVMCQSNKTPPPPPTPVVKPDGEVYMPGVDPEFRWYVVVRGKNVGVVQGAYVSLLTCTFKSHQLTYLFTERSPKAGSRVFPAASIAASRTKLRHALNSWKSSVSVLLPYACSRLCKQSQPPVAGSVDL